MRFVGGKVVEWLTQWVVVMVDGGWWVVCDLGLN